MKKKILVVAGLLAMSGALTAQSVYPGQHAGKLYKPQNKMFHFCKTFCSKITLVNTIQNVILNPI